jgi:hypothetical protein
MRYANCPTCGSLCRYVSENFERAQILIGAEHDVIKSELRRLSEANVRLMLAAEKGISELSSEILLELYFKKVQQEEIRKQIENEEWDAKYWDQQRLTRYIDFEKFFGIKIENAE